jgi:hypothetical protein
MDLRVRDALIKPAMKLLATPLRRAVFVLLLINGIPTCESIFNGTRPTWTMAHGRSATEQMTGHYVQYEFYYFWFGLNVVPFDPNVPERWHRVRFGYPISPITIDIEQRAWQLQGVVETNWLLLKLLASAFSWGTIETVLFVGRRSVGHVRT